MMYKLYNPDITFDIHSVESIQILRDVDYLLIRMRSGHIITVTGTKQDLKSLAEDILDQRIKAEMDLAPRRSAFIG